MLVNVALLVLLGVISTWKKSNPYDTGSERNKHRDDTKRDCHSMQSRTTETNQLSLAPSVFPAVEKWLFVHGLWGRVWLLVSTCVGPRSSLSAKH